MSESSAVQQLQRSNWTLAFLGLCIFTFVVVTYRVRIAEVGIAVAVIGLLLQRGGVRAPAPIVVYVLFVLWAGAGSFVSQFPEIATEQVVERLKLAAVMLVAVNALQTERQVRLFQLFYLVCFILFPARGALVNYLGGYHPFGRAVWNYIYQNPNDLAALSLLALGPALAIWSSESERRMIRIGAGVGGIVLLIVILLTQSRGVFLGLLIGMGPAAVRLFARRPSNIVAAIVVAVIVGFVTPTSVWERFSGLEKLTSASTVAEADPEGSAEQRLEIQEVAMRIAIDNLLFGVGLGVYPNANAMYAPGLGKRDTHNTYLNLAAEVGLPGLVLWCGLFLMVLARARRIRKVAGVTVLGQQQVWIERALVGFLVAGAVGSYSSLTFPHLVLAAIWCSSTILAREAVGGTTASAVRNG